MATQAGPTGIAQGLTAKNNLATQNLQDSAVTNNAQSQAMAAQNLSMKGGMGSGSRERLHAQGAQNLMNTKQDASNQGAMNNLNITADDEKRKLGLLKDLPSMFMNDAQMDLGKKNTDVSNSMGTANNFYNQDMQAWGANQMAMGQAQQYNAANKGILSGLF